jgi:hypothetical protein
MSDNACSRQLTNKPRRHKSCRAGKIRLESGSTMFDYESPKPKQAVDYTGLKIVAILAPVFFLITFLSNADTGLAACIVLGMIMLAVKIRWNLRKHIWFWAIIAIILVLHVPLAFMVRWPQGNGPTLFYTMPVGIADFLIILGATGLAERLFSKGVSSNDEGE